MQPKRALLLVACGGLVAALATVAVPVSALPAAAGTDCHAGPGLKVNKWVGQQSSGEIGLWNNDKNWSLGRYPRFTSMHQVACIRTRAHVVMWQGSGLHVHVAAIDMGGTGVLEVRPSNSLFVEANPHEVVSSVAPDARLEVAGAMLGGHGRIDVQGELTLSPGSGKINKLATRPCERDCTTGLRGRFGTISVEPGGLFVVGARARVADSYHVVIIGGEMR